MSQVASNESSFSTSDGAVGSNLSVNADGDVHPGKSFEVGPPCKFYVFADPDDIGGLYGHAFPGLIDQDGRELRVGLFKGADILAVDPAKGIVYMAAEGALPAFLSGGIVSLFMPAAGLALTAMKVVQYTAIAAAGLVGVVHVAAGTGVGQLRDDFGYQFTVCRGWDVSPVDYRRIWEVMADWKRRSDHGELLYDSKVSDGDGNCTTFADKACQAVGITLPFAAAGANPGNMARWYLSDPRFVARAIETDSRQEKVPAGGAGKFKHPWRYASGGISALPLSVLGRWDRHRSGPRVGPGSAPAGPPGRR